MIYNVASPAKTLAMAPVFATTVLVVPTVQTTALAAVNVTVLVAVTAAVVSATAAVPATANLVVTAANHSAMESVTAMPQLCITRRLYIARLCLETILPMATHVTARPIVLVVVHVPSFAPKGAPALGVFAAPSVFPTARDTAPATILAVSSAA